MMQQILPMMFMSHTTPDTTTSSFTTVISKYLIEYGGGIQELLPNRIQLVLVSMVKQGWLEHGLDQLFRFITWTCVVIILALM